MASPKPRTLRIFVVDDDDADTLMIEEALAAAAVPPETQRAHDGREALDLLRAESEGQQKDLPDLILLDLNMPRMGGLQLLEELKSDSQLQAIPVVVLTTSDAHPDILASYRHHASAFVTKPLDLDSFETAVQKINSFFADTAELP
ncbi:response regulator [Actinoplanes sp. Pm04-4]|uniref:Response regulator n=1 Tax=Paractinoplanes pyxinae TaxID=2997416 RepID=A0ABT4BB29_9ACTN|nr:response regulator [Actinoplanes pyxinae]MCY1143723.1 response regulator [Actinoplanes pyxinae]